MQVRVTPSVALRCAGGVAIGGLITTVALEAEAALDDTVAVYTPALPYVCGIVNAVDCSIAPSPNDQIHVAPTALELTLNTSGTPVVPLPDTFRKDTGNVGAGDGAGPLVGTTRVCALSSGPTDAVTSAVSLAVSVADAVPLALVGTCAGAMVPRVVVNVTTTSVNGAPFAF